MMNPMKALGKTFGDSIGDVAKTLNHLVELQEKQVGILEDIRDELKGKD